MIPTAHERLQELHEKMLDWICEHIKEDEDLFHALYGRIGFAQSELDPEIECRIYKLYNALPPKEKLELKVKAEYAEFLSFWRTLSADELIDQAEKISIVNKLNKSMCECLLDEQSAYFARFSEPLEAISERVMEHNNSHEWSLIGQIIGNMYDAQDGGYSFDEDEDQDTVLEQTM